MAVLLLLFCDHFNRLHYGSYFSVCLAVLYEILTWKQKSKNQNWCEHSA